MNHNNSAIMKKIKNKKLYGGFTPEQIGKMTPEVYDKHRDSIIEDMESESKSRNVYSAIDIAYQLDETLNAMVGILELHGYTVKRPSECWFDKVKTQSISRESSIFQLKSFYRDRYGRTPHLFKRLEDANENVGVLCDKIKIDPNYIKPILGTGKKTIKNLMNILDSHGLI